MFDSYNSLMRTKLIVFTSYPLVEVVDQGTGNKWSLFSS